MQALISGSPTVPALSGALERTTWLRGLSISGGGRLWGCEPSPIADASDADIAPALAEANFPALTMAIAHLAGDPGLFGDRHRPNGMLLREDFAGIDEDARAEILSTALRVLGDYRDGRVQSGWRPDGGQLHAMLRFASGGDIGDEYLPMMVGELNLEGIDNYGEAVADRQCAVLRQLVPVCSVLADLRRLVQRAGGRPRLGAP